MQALGRVERDVKFRRGDAGDSKSIADIVSAPLCTLVVRVAVAEGALEKADLLVSDAFVMDVSCR